MFALIRALPLDRLVWEQAPVVALSWFLAETFYKFHSFTLECGAFLGTWLLLDAAVHGGRDLVIRSRR